MMLSRFVRRALPRFAGMESQYLDLVQVRQQLEASPPSSPGEYDAVMRKLRDVRNARPIEVAEEMEKIIGRMLENRQRVLSVHLISLLAKYAKAECFRRVDDPPTARKFYDVLNKLNEVAQRDDLSVYELRMLTTAFFDVGNFQAGIEHLQFLQEKYPNLEVGFYEFVLKTMANRTRTLAGTARRSRRPAPSVERNLDRAAPLAEKILQEVTARQEHPSFQMLANAVRIAAESNNKRLLLRFLDTLEKDTKVEDLDGSLVVTIVNGLFRTGCTERLASVVERLEAANKEVPPDFYTKLLTRLQREPQVDLAKMERVYTKVDAQPGAVDPGVHRAMLRAYADAGACEKMEDVIGRLKSSGATVNSGMNSLLARGYAVANNNKKMMKVIKQISEDEDGVLHAEAALACLKSCKDNESNAQKLVKAALPAVERDLNRDRPASARVVTREAKAFYALAYHFGDEALRKEVKASVERIPVLTTFAKMDSDRAWELNAAAALEDVARIDEVLDDAIANASTDAEKEELFYAALQAKMAVAPDTVDELWQRDIPRSEVSYIVYALFLGRRKNMGGAVEVLHAMREKGFKPPMYMLRELMTQGNSREQREPVERVLNELYPRDQKPSTALGDEKQWAEQPAPRPRRTGASGGGGGGGRGGGGRGAEEGGADADGKNLGNGWFEYVDPNSQKSYYHNPATGQTQWHAPN